MGTRRIESPGLLCGASSAATAVAPRYLCVCFRWSRAAGSGRTLSSPRYFYPTSTPSPRRAKSDCYADADGVVNVQSHVLGAADLRARVYAAERKDAARDRCGIGSASRSAQLRSASRASNARRTPDASWRSARRFRP